MGNDKNEFRLRIICIEKMRMNSVGIDVSKGILGLLVFDAGNIHLNDSQTAERKKESAREKRIRKYREHMDRVSHRKNTDNIKDDGR